MLLVLLVLLLVLLLLFFTIINIITIITIITIINVIIESISMSIRRPGVSLGRLKDHQLTQMTALFSAHARVSCAQRPVVVKHIVTDAPQRPAAVSARVEVAEDLSDLPHELMRLHILVHGSALNVPELKAEVVQQDLTGLTGLLHGGHARRELSHSRIPHIQDCHRLISLLIALSGLHGGDGLTGLHDAHWLRGRPRRHGAHWLLNLWLYCTARAQETVHAAEARKRRSGQGAQRGFEPQNGCCC